MSQPPNQPFDPNAHAAQQYAAADAAQQQPHQQQPYQQFAEQPAPKRKSRLLQIVVAVAVAILVPLGWFLFQQYQATKNLQVGNCITLTGETTNAEEKKVDCDDKSLFSWEITHVGDNTDECSREQQYYEITVDGRRSARATKVACLVERFHEGVCYEYVENNELSPFRVSECGGSALKVTKRIDESNGTCADGEEPLGYGDVARTYCVEVNN